MNKIAYINKEFQMDQLEKEVITIKEYKWRIIQKDKKTKF